MSVIRQPDVLGRTTRRRVVGMTAAIFTTTIEAIAVGTWFLLVVFEPRTLSTALAGVGILFCGTLVRASVFGVATSELVEMIRPQRLGVIVFGTAGWLLWLLTAEWIGGGIGMFVAGVVLLIVLSLQFTLERRLFRTQGSFNPIRPRCTLLPATLTAAGASTLLGSVWLTSWTAALSSVSVGGRQIVFHIEAVQIGFALFALGMFLAHRQRFRTSIGE